MSTVLGIDLGTQALKVLFLDVDDASVVETASASLELDQRDGGVAEQQPDWWLKALKEALGEVDPNIRESAKAVSVSGQQHGFVAVDSDNKVLAPAKLWCDTSTGTHCDAIMDALGGFDACVAEAGNPILPGYTASKVSWLRAEQPEAYGRLDGILLPHDYLNLVLTGERCMEAGDASGTGFFDVRNRQWSRSVLRAIDPDRDLTECLPMLRLGNSAIGELRSRAAEKFGLPAGIPVAIGGGDNMMGAIGTGNLKPGNMTMSLGTSGTVYAHADEPVVDPGGNVAAFCGSTGGWLPLLCTMNCTVSTELMRDLLGTDLAGFEAQIRSAERGAEGIITLPFFNGERAPKLPDASGCVVGLSSRNLTPENLLRSAVEGATFALRYGIDELASLGVSADDIVLTGGGARSECWRQLVADVADTPVTVYAQDEGAALGAAIQALQLLSPDTEIADVASLALTRDETRCREPSREAVEQYAELYRSYQDAVQTVTRLYQ